MFFVYAIYHPKTDKIYIGQTDNLPNRLREHNDAECQRHTYTKRIGVGWKLIYSEEQPTRSLALLREKQLKSYQGRLFIKNLINHIPP
ncbi:MAG: GIY-YIG nuclease family protein [Candidatus Shapirobacteria bacterium]|nr:GIY-YIG nuclease family protein [Candidatus Shapirobacteria bacterium]